MASEPFEPSDIAEYIGRSLAYFRGEPYDGTEQSLFTDAANGALKWQRQFDIPGDVGRFDRGYLTITDRIKHMLVSQGGKNIYPGPIEDEFKTVQWVDQIMVVGEGREFLTAIVVPDFEAIEKYAASNDIRYDGPDDLVGHESIKALFDAEFRSYSRSAASHEKIRDFRLVAEPFTVENGTMTPTMKLKRRVIEQQLGADGGLTVSDLAGMTDHDEAFGDYFPDTLELLEAIAGMRPFATGSIAIGGHTLTGDERDPHRLRGMGLLHVPEDRIRMGLVPSFEAFESAALGFVDDPAYGTGPILSQGRMIADARRKMELYDVRPPAPRLRTASFSGGNQQKLVLAREIERGPKVLLVGQPTRGVDIGAIEFIHKRLIALRDQGVAILLVSVELDEIMSLSDRILAMCGGRITGERRPDETNEGELGLLMAGVAA